MSFAHGVPKVKFHAQKSDIHFQQQLYLFKDFILMRYWPIIFILTLSISCLDPINPEMFKKASKLLLAVSKKSGSFEWATNDSIPVKVLVKNPSRVKNITIDFGNNTNKFTLTFETTSTNDTNLHLYCSYESSGRKMIHGFLLQNDNGFERRDSISFEIGVKPTIKNDKKVQILNDPKKGQRFFCWIEAIGSEPLKYQWFFGNDSLVTKTQGQLTFNSLSSTDEGTYVVKIMNRYGEDSSLPYVLNFSNNTSAPKILLHPQDAQVTLGSYIQLRVHAEGLVVTYQWQENRKNIANASDSVLRIGPITIKDSAKTFRCVVSNSNGADTSKDALITVLNQEQPPQIVSHPSDQQVSVGQSAKFSLKATGTNLSFQWSKNGIILDGANSSEYQTGPVSSKDSGSTFQCKVANNLSSLFSRAALLTVTSMDKLSIIKQPQDIQVQEHESARFSVVAVGQNLQYQWLKNSKDISGAISTGYEIVDALKSDSGALFCCKIVNQFGAIISREALLKVNSDIGKKPKITKQPKDLNVGEGDTVFFEIESQGEDPKYCWQENRKNIPSSNSQKYSFTNATTDKDGSLFRCIVSNSSGSDTSTEAKLSVGEIPPKIIQNLNNSLLESTKPCTVSIVAKGGKCTYTWFKDFTEIKSSKEPFLDFVSPSTSDIGSYYVTVSNNKGQVTSDTIYCVLMKSKFKSALEITSSLLLRSISEDDVACFLDDVTKLTFINPYTKNRWIYSAFGDNIIRDACLFVNKMFCFPLYVKEFERDSILFFSSDGLYRGACTFQKSVSGFCSAAMKNGNVFFQRAAFDTSRLTCVNSTNFQKVWTKEIPPQSFAVTIAKNATIGIVGYENNSIVSKFINSSGTVTNSAVLGSVSMTGEFNNSVKIVFDENNDMYVSLQIRIASSGLVFYISKINSTGAVSWNISIPLTSKDGMYSGMLITPNNKLLFLRNSGVYSIDKSTGSIEWKYEPSNQHVVQPWSFHGILNDNNIYFISEHVCLMNLEGKKLGSIRLPENSKPKEFWISNGGDLFILSDKGDLYGAKSKATAPAQTSWPVIGADLQRTYQAR